MGVVFPKPPPPVATPLILHPTAIFIVADCALHVLNLIVSKATNVADITN